MMSKTITFLCLFCLQRACGMPEQGVWTAELTKDHQYFAVHKSMYNKSGISVKVACHSNHEVAVDIQWVLRESPCAFEYFGIGKSEELIETYFAMPYVDLGYEYNDVVFQGSEEQTFACSEHAITLKDESTKPATKSKSIPKDKDKNVTTTAAPVTKVSQKSAQPKTTKAEQKQRRKRAVAPVKPNETKKPAPKMTMKPGQNVDHDNVAKTWTDGIYLFIIRIKPVSPNETFNATVTVRMVGPTGSYLSAIDWPLLPFYGAMCIFYVLIGLSWLVLASCNWRDLLRIQFWIGGVIMLGMLEKALFYAEHQTINYTGQSVRGVVIFAEIISCMKRTLARMLIVIVSLGFGIVKPRLGPMLHRVIGMGALYFILGVIEGCLRVTTPKGDPSNHPLLASIPLAILDSAICWWIFTSLVQTTRTLRLRRNVVKLSLYRHFTNTLIFAILASIAFMIWSLKEYKLPTCMKDWKELWIDSAFWPLLFSVILIVIMVLWRPTNNNQRYAFSPLLDAADDEDEEDDAVMNDAFEGMKMRGVKNQSNGSPKQRDVKTEDDLKWIEENIPSSVADSALPTLLDSDEEIMTTKFEMSKME